ncbi:hypothetical protein GIB67_007137, partial [Kingdonia uniflora]
DLPRTFPDHPWLDTPEGHASLRRVLVGYFFRDSYVGYCQDCGSFRRYEFDVSLVDTEWFCAFSLRVCGQSAGIGVLSMAKQAILRMTGNNKVTGNSWGRNFVVFNILQ